MHGFPPLRVMFKCRVAVCGAAAGSMPPSARPARHATTPSPTTTCLTHTRTRLHTPAHPPAPLDGQPSTSRLPASLSCLPDLPSAASLPRPASLPAHPPTHPPGQCAGAACPPAPLPEPASGPRRAPDPEPARRTGRGHRGRFGMRVRSTRRTFHFVCWLSHH